jgi:peptidoglycan/xylan/chitin deacetylase (PgdA/CDA1 family)
LSPLLLKRLLGTLLRNQGKAARDGILIYHSVGGGPMSTPVSAFEAQMGWLAENAAVVSLDELLDIPNPGNLRIALSFDDGYRSLHDVVAPILAARKFPAIVYLNSGLAGEDRHLPSRADLGHYPNEHFLTWGEVEELAKLHWSVGGHGIEHVDLTKLSVAEARNQVAGCKAEIEGRVGLGCRHFAYTWGRFSPSVSAVVADAGYCSAASGLHGALMPDSDRFALPRMDIRADYQLRDFVDVVTGRWDYLRLKQRLARRIS